MTGPSPAETTRHASQRVTYHETLTLHNTTGFHALSIRLAVVLEEDGVLAIYLYYFGLRNIILPFRRQVGF